MERQADQPIDEPEKLERYVELLDRLMKAGFVKKHGHMKDAHIIGFTARGWRLIHELQAIEDAGPTLTAEDRRVLFRILRTAKPIRRVNGQR